MTPTKRAAATAFAKERLRWREVKGVAPVEDLEYLDWIRHRACVVCVARGMQQLTKTESAHVGERGLRQKCSDREAIPLCGWEHHREGRTAAHKLQKRFFAFHGLDKEILIEQLNREYDRQRGNK